MADLHEPSSSAAFGTRLPADPFAPQPLDDMASLLMSVPDAIVVCDVEGRIAVVNDQLCEIFRYREEELIGRSVEMLLPQRFRADHPGLRSAYVADPLIRPMGQFREVLGRRSDGQEILVEIRLRMFEASGGMFVAAAVRDVSELRMLHQILRNSNHVLEMLASGESVPRVLSELVERIDQTYPEALCSILSLERTGKRLSTILAPRVPAAFCAALGEANDEEVQPYFVELIASDSRVVLPDLAAEGPPRGFRELAAASGLGSFWLEPIRDSRRGVLGAIVVYHRDVHYPDKRETEMVAAAAHLAGIALERDLRTRELAEKEEQLRQSQKLEAVGTLTGGIAHEFNNLLQVILGYTTCALDVLPEESGARDDLNQVLSATREARSLTRQLLSFSRQQPLQKSVVEVNRVVEDVGKMLRPVIDADIEIALVCDPSLPPIIVDPGQLRQVLINLCLNARDAIGAGGRIEIATRCEVVPSTADPASAAQPRQSAVSIVVTDNGCGMSADVKERIFDPFFTTKEVGKGTGLGLAVVHGIIRDHHGSIDVQSQPGEGTTFRLTFPTADVGQRESLADQGEPHAAAKLRGTETILIAEDESSVRTLIARSLSAAGYRVLTTVDGASAIEQFHARPSELHLAVLDLTMPGADGMSVAAAIRSRCPTLPIIILTGCPNETRREDGSPFSTLLVKPVEPAVLLKEVRSLLDAMKTASENLD